MLNPHSPFSLAAISWPKVAGPSANDHRLTTATRFDRCFRLFALQLATRSRYNLIKKIIVINWQKRGDAGPGESNRVESSGVERAVQAFCLQASCS